MDLSVEVLLHAYAQGLFPMGNDGGGIDWYCPDPRAIIPIEAAMPNRTMRKILRSGRFVFTFDTAFTDVMQACADREDTWITDRMVHAYTELHHAGHAHSAEAWEDGALVGGIYGVSIGAAFFGESMFSRADNAGKAAFQHLMAQLRSRDFRLFDSQIINDFTRTLGAVEIPFEDFQRKLVFGVRMPRRW
ncbi:MAG: leucyl/phenylalanyl-tRNA--protein transferase [Flavobacteriales bacterium]|nr:MAG: leucyl/phenylalanyl-tRNA--protein transferase [Flavobacteriales bacterium]